MSKQDTELNTMTSEYIEKLISYYKHKKGLLDNSLDIKIQDVSGEIIYQINTAYSHFLMARTMEYIQGIKYDLNNKIDQLENELKNRKNG